MLAEGNYKLSLHKYFDLVSRGYSVRNKQSTPNKINIVKSKF